MTAEPALLDGLEQEARAAGVAQAQVGAERGEEVGGDLAWRHYPEPRLRRWLSRRCSTSLLRAHGPTGHEHLAFDAVREGVGDVAEIETDAIGNLVARRAGAADGPLLALFAHLDVIGLAAAHVDDDGLIPVHTLGGWRAAIAYGQRVEISTANGDGARRRRAPHEGRREGRVDAALRGRRRARRRGGAGARRTRRPDGRRRSARRARGRSRRLAQPRQPRGRLRRARGAAAAGGGGRRGRRGGGGGCARGARRRRCSRRGASAAARRGDRDRRDLRDRRAGRRPQQGRRPQARRRSGDLPRPTGLATRLRRARRGRAARRESPTRSRRE